MRFMIVLMLLDAGLVHGQQSASSNQQSANDARAKRAAREQAVKKVGPIARNLVEEYGESAVSAIQACSPAAGAQLAQFHESGSLKMLPAPYELLAAISRDRGGDDVVKFAIAHEELRDPQRFAVFVDDPMTYAMSLKTLDAGVAEHKEAVELIRYIGERLQQEPDARAKEKTVQQYVGGGIALIVVLLVWRSRRNNVG